MLGKLIYMQERKGIDVTQLTLNELDKLYEEAHFAKVDIMIDFGFGAGSLTRNSKNIIDDLMNFFKKAKVAGNPTAKGLIGKDFEEYLTNMLGEKGSFSKGGRDFDGGISNRWWEAKSGQYWDLIMNDTKKLELFKSSMGDRLRIAKDNGATYELFSNTPIPQKIKDWLIKKGIPYTELLD